MSSDPLALLRPLHWPEPVPWWPPAPGWWLLALLLLAGAVVAWRHHRHHRPESAIELLERLAHHRGDDRHFVVELNLALKRIALSRFPAAEVAPLSGEAWLAFLDATGGHGDFAAGVGRVLAQAPYRAAVRLDDRASLLALCRRWAEHVVATGRSA